MCFQITEPVLHSVVDYYSAVCAGLIRRGRYNIHNLESGRLPTEEKNSPAIRRSLFAYSFLAVRWFLRSSEKERLVIG